jgi:hypothetical protein
LYGRSLSYDNDKQGKHQEQRQHKILKLFVLAAVISLTVLLDGGGSLTFLRRQSALMPPPLPLPTTAKPTTIAKDNEDGSLLSLTLNEIIIDPLNNAINSITNTNPSSNENLSENGLPTFNHFPSSDSMCHTDANNRTDETIAAYCKDVTCMHHEKDVDDELFVSLGEDASKEEYRGGCKMLWFAAMHESDNLCKFAATGQHAYNVDYSIALNSALKNAHDSLQPVLLLGRLGTENENSTEPKKFGMWAQQ